MGLVGRVAAGGVDPPRFEDLIHPTGCVVQIWGMTELGRVSTFKAPARGVAGSEIVDAMATGASGEICIRSPMRMRYYLAMPTETAAAFDDDGFYRTGDIAYCRDGVWYIISRIKDLIKCAVGNCRRPSVADAAVIGVTPPGGSSEVPRAYIVRAESSLTESDIHVWVSERFKALDGGIEIDRQDAQDITARVICASNEFISVYSSKHNVNLKYTTALLPSMELKKFEQLPGFDVRNRS
ncbi:hypothetical protein V1508DRAFT_399944 [Lipomyces doorenjongii]|uniref:uncharacterized protein n=1 Tax=Lipomyces doorenjongii TaxID=383834 RepID=UPI0034CF81D2